MAADVRTGPLAIFGETPAKIDNDAFVVDAATREDGLEPDAHRPFGDGGISPSRQV
ncbi:hypothetical protein ABTW96_22485 [Nocardia beijingensis]|uniref:hypothetical protein n=1 Tax=Nocardia beijingensis TaxID=95162 RepID=UPI00332E11EE